MEHIRRIDACYKHINPRVALLLLICTQWIRIDAHAAPILGVSPETSAPVHATQGTAPLVLLTVARDHSMSFPAYNDMTDLDGDGIIDIRFNPKFSYLGLFNPKYCYTYVNGATKNASYFTPSAQANPFDVPLSSDPSGCVQPASGGSIYWSGNWLNYVTTSRIDAMRVALYGGYRDVDTATSTILRRAYIPQDGHAWAKEYRNQNPAALDYSGYKLRSYAPFGTPGDDYTGGPPLYHLFGNLTTTVDSSAAGNDAYDLGYSTTGSPPTRRRNEINVPVIPTAANNNITSYSTSMVDDVGQSCLNLDHCSQDYAPLLRVVQYSGTRVWRWASSQRPVLDYHPTPIGYVAAYPGGTKGNMVGFGNVGDDLTAYPYHHPILTDYTVRVEVCKPGYIDGCKKYTSNNVDTYKPTGVLQDYGDNDSVKFGLMTGSYDKNLSGGRIRKNIGSFGDEINDDGTFAYKSNLNLVSIIKQLDNIRIRNFNNPTDLTQNANRTAFVVPNYANMYFGNNFIYKNTWSFNESIMTDGNYGDWGNPIAEMMYEGLRYFAGGPNRTTGTGTGAGPTPAFDSSSTRTEDAAVGLTSASWTDPYTASTWCAKPNIVMVSGPNPSFDSDQLPGSPFNTAFTDKLKNEAGQFLDAGSMTTYIGGKEGINGTSQFIGEKWNGAAVKDLNPTLKADVDLAYIRGMVPDETDNQGSFLSAGVAYWAKSESLRAFGGNKIPTVDTYSMVLNAPFPSIKIPFPASGKKTVTIYPFGKTQLAYQNDRDIQKASYAPTNQLVGVYPTFIQDPGNASNNFRLSFYANFEDHAWGGDFEMDFMVFYDIQVLGGGSSVQVTITPFSKGGSAMQNVGYVITGIGAADGAYVQVQSINSAWPYYMNTPTTPTPRPPGYCDSASFTSAPCASLPSANGVGVARTHNTIAADAAGDPELKNPLWYAARWGGYPDGVPPTGPLGALEKPSHYVQVYSPANLKVAFQQMIQAVLDNSATVGSVTSSSGELHGSTQLFTASYNSGTLYGDLTATPYTGNYGVPVSADAQLAALPSFSSRNVLFASSGGTMMQFTNANLAASSWGTYFDSADVIDFIAGDNSKDIFHLGTLRTRASLLGTIINSMAVFSQDTGDVYVGSNDGMLHAFNASTMSERFAFIPKSMITTASADGKSVLNAMSKPSFTGRYYVDGDIAVSESSLADSGMASDSNYLIGFLGRGGRGLFGLKINKTTHLPTSSWEYYTAANADNDLGYLLGQPIIERLGDGTNVAIFGNGYGSESNQAALYVVRLRDGVILAKYLTCTGTGGTGKTSCVASYDTSFPNGLATPGVVRKNGFVTYAYAGDYRGNVWKFDLSMLTGSSSLLSNTYQYSGSNLSGSIFKFFSAVDAGGNPQPIVAPIATGYSYDSTDNAVKNRQFVFFGTGSDLSATSADLNSLQTQSFYGLLDPMTPASPTYATTPAVPSTRGAGNNQLRVRTLDPTPGTFAGYKSAANSVKVRAMDAAVAGDMANAAGWVMDWYAPGGGVISAGQPSEKVFTAATLRSSVVPTVVVSSSIASTGTCVTSGAGYLNAFDAYHGGSLVGTSYFDINRNGSSTDEKPNLVNKFITSIDFGIGAIGQAGFAGSNVIVQGSGVKPAGNPTNTGDVGTAPSTVVSRRTSWREITN